MIIFELSEDVHIMVETFCRRAENYRRERSFADYTIYCVDVGVTGGITCGSVLLLSDMVT